VGTMSGTVWYVNWQDGSTVKLLAGHGNKVNLGPEVHVICV